jgi:hypothetical protein
MTAPPPPPPPESPTPAAPPPPPPPSAPSGSPADRVRAAYGRRAETDYFFTRPGLNIFLTIITCGIFGLFIFYQLMRRDRDHNLRRYEMLDAANTLAWNQAVARGMADELRPDFERNAENLEALRRLTTEFRDPVIWLVIAIFASVATYVAYIFIDQDLDKHDRAEGAAESELASIFGRLGQELPTSDPARVKGKHSYVGRIIATIATCGIYTYWWTYDLAVEGNRHFEQNWPWEDALVRVVDQLSATSAP